MVYSFLFSPIPPQVRPSVLGDSCCCCALVPLGGTEGIEICSRTCTNTYPVFHKYDDLFLEEFLPIQQSYIVGRETNQ